MLVSNTVYVLYDTPHNNRLPLDSPVASEKYNHLKDKDG